MLNIAPDRLVTIEDGIDPDGTVTYPELGGAGGLIDSTPGFSRTRYHRIQAIGMDAQRRCLGVVLANRIETRIPYELLEACGFRVPVTKDAT